MLHTLACFACISFMRLKTSTNAVEITILPVPAVRIIGTIERLRHRIKLMIARQLDVSQSPTWSQQLHPLFVPLHHDIVMICHGVRYFNVASQL
jgi:hypothetical protein